VQELPADGWPQGDVGSEPGRHKNLPARLAAFLRTSFEAERGRWFLWVPVIFACGTAVFSEPLAKKPAGTAYRKKSSFSSYAALWNGGEAAL